MRQEMRGSHAWCALRRILSGVAFLVPAFIARTASAQSLRYRPPASALVLLAPAGTPVQRQRRATPTIPLGEQSLGGGGRGCRGALLGLAIGAGAGVGVALFLNEVEPPAELERLVGLPTLLGIWGLVVGYGVGRGG